MGLRSHFRTQVLLTSLPKAVSVAILQFTAWSFPCLLQSDGEGKNMGPSSHQRYFSSKGTRLPSANTMILVTFRVNATLEI